MINCKDCKFWQQRTDNFGKPVGNWATCSKLMTNPFVIQAVLIPNMDDVEVELNTRDTFGCVLGESKHEKKDKA